MAKATRADSSTTDVLEREAQSDDASAISSDHGLQRGDDGKGNSFWRVSIIRIRRRISRTFYDRTYGSRAEAEKFARAYRDAILAEIPRVPKPALIRKHRDTNTGITGVMPRHRKGNLVGHEATFADRSGVKRMHFAVSRYGKEGSRLRAEAQREFWIAEAMLQFIAVNRKTGDTDLSLFSESVMASLHWQDDVEAWFEETLKKINARFDELRPFWLTLRVACYMGERIVLNLSDGGWPAQQRKASVMYATRGLEASLPLACDKAVALIKDLFGKSVAERFLTQHGAKFEPDNFDPTTGISIREQP